MNYEVLEQQRLRLLQRRIANVDINTTKTLYLKRDLTDKDIHILTKKGWKPIQVKNTWYVMKDWLDYCGCLFTWKIVINTNTNKIFRFAYKSRLKVPSQPYFVKKYETNSWNVNVYFPCIKELILMGIVEPEKIHKGAGYDEDEE